MIVILLSQTLKNLRTPEAIAENTVPNPLPAFLRIFFSNFSYVRVFDTLVPQTTNLLNSITILSAYYTNLIRYCQTNNQQIRKFLLLFC